MSDLRGRVARLERDDPPAGDDGVQLVVLTLAGEGDPRGWVRTAANPTVVVWYGAPGETPPDVRGWGVKVIDLLAGDCRWSDL